MTANNFINEYAQTAIDATKNVNLLPSVVIAMAAIESGWNTNKLSTEANNFFSIKAYTNPNGTPIIYANDDLSNEPFRTYATPKDSFNDFVDFLYKQNARYLSHGLATATTPQEQLQAIMSAGYATSTYTGTALNIISSHSLQDFDKVKQTETQDTTAAMVISEQKKKKIIYLIIVALLFAAFVIVYSYS